MSEPVQPALGTVITAQLLQFIKSDELHDAEGNRFEIGTTPTGLPLVRSVTTGKCFLLMAGDLVELAKRAGIHLTDR
jgi:hypothetical protein